MPAYLYEAVRRQARVEERDASALMRRLAEDYTRRKFKQRGEDYPGQQEMDMQAAAEGMTAHG